MDTKKLIEVYTGLTSNMYSHYYGKEREIDDYIKSMNLSKEDLLILSNLLIQDNVFGWLDFISSKISILAEDNPLFINLIVSIIKKVKNDLAQGSFVRGLIRLGEENPDLGLKIYDKILISQIYAEAVDYTGLILGGAGKKDPKRIKKYILRILNSTEDIEQLNIAKVASIKAMRVMIEGKDKLEEEKFFFDMLEKVSKIENPSPIRIEALNFNIDMFKFNKEVCYKNMIHLITNRSNEELCYLLAHRLSIFGLKDNKKEFTLIELLANSNDLNVLNEVAHYLARNHSKNKDKTFEIFITLIEKEKYFELRNLPYMLNEMGGKDFNFYYKKISDFINSEKNKKLLYILSELLRYLTEKCEENIPKEELLRKQVYDRITILK